MITTILLDLDDTILADDEATDIAFAAVANHAHRKAGAHPELLVNSIREHSAQLWAQGPFPDWLHDIGTGPLEGLRTRFEGEDRHWEVMREWGPMFRQLSWERALHTISIRNVALAAELNAMFEVERGKANPWCDRAEEALTSLAEHYTLGMVTNGISDVQRTKIEATDMARYFKTIVISGELGVGKPESAIYQHALDQLGVSPEETIMVGDNYRRDVLGAQAVGIRGVWITMGRDQPEGDDPWLSIEGLRDLPAILRDLNQGA